jgi:hypothetical protein
MHLFSNTGRNGSSKYIQTKRLRIFDLAGFNKCYHSKIVANRLNFHLILVAKY